MLNENVPRALQRRISLPRNDTEESTASLSPHHGRSLAGVLLGVLHAGVALHVTTPVKLAVAVPRACVLVSVVPAATAQQVTATRP